MNIFKEITYCYRHKLPFVAYRKPNDNLVKGIFQQNDLLYLSKNYTEAGFIFVPFDNEKQAIITPIEESEVIEQKIDIKPHFDKPHLYKPNNDILKENHIKLVERAIEEIDQHILKKVVLSRKETIKLNEFNLVSTFQKLIKTYPIAMVYVWYHPRIGLWLGATPELLLKVKADKFKTVALAGTQIYTDKLPVFWGQKEIKEQQLVTDYIVEKLSKVCKNVKQNITETVRVGNLLHLKTEIFGDFKTKITNFKSLLNDIHPTPAVCGFPREVSKKFILQNENYNRAFYTGFLGELNFGGHNTKEQKSELFVNLRCMEVKNNTAIIFVGGGITKQSNPEKEWEETVAKSNVMKKVII